MRKQKTPSIFMKYLEAVETNDLESATEILNKLKM